jgi:putative tryptophan/tyrosine transport system substrate-binding protein
MNRREFITLLGGAAAAWPLAAQAQQGERVRRIGILNPFGDDDLEVQANVAAFRQTLQKLGWTDGRNVRIDYRWSGANPARILELVKELVGLNPDVILGVSPLALQPLLQETSSIPIIFTQVADPLGAGLVASLARPGGNLTGFTVAEFQTFAKLLELLKEIAPNVMRVAVLFNPDQIPQAGMLRAVETAAPSVRVQVTAAAGRDVAQLERTIDQFANGPNGGLIVLPNPITIGNRKFIIARAAQHGLPAAYPFGQFVKDGGLISYGIDLADQYRQAASYVDRVLRGEKPADLPVQQPTKFELAVNLRTAKVLGLEVPPMLLARADEVIE